MAVELDMFRSAAPIEPREYTTTGIVVNSFNNEALKGVDVSITTKTNPKFPGVPFTTTYCKTNEIGKFELTYTLEVVPYVETITIDWVWNEREAFDSGDLIDQKVEFADDGSVTYTIFYNYKGENITAIGKSRPSLLTAAGTRRKLQSIAKASAVDDLYTQILDYDGGSTEKELDDGYKVNEKPEIKFDFPEYNPQTRLPYTKSQEVKPRLNTVKLVTTKKQMEKDISQSGTLDSKTTKEIKKGGSRSLPTPQKTILKSAKTLSDKLIPYIIGILAAFGISQVKNWLDGKNNLQNTKTTCPSRAKLNKQIKKRNNVVKQLNNLYKVVDSATKAIGIALGLIKIFQVIINVLKFLPLPTSVPPGIGFPVSLINKIRDALNAASGKIKQFSKIGGIVLTALILLRALLNAALTLLGLADQKMQECAEQYAEEDGGDNAFNNMQIALNDELVAISKQQAEEELSPVVGLVNGFKMGIETDPKYKVGTLDRRRATATNPQGVVMLRGEPSFSASDQILIDELAFYITNNNLRA